MPVLAGAKDTGCTEPTSELVQELFQWIGRHTDYDVSHGRANPPEIMFCEAGDEIDYANDATIVEPNDRAFYDYINRRIHLVLPWRQSEPRDVALLLHELVHEVQFSNRSWECPTATEWEAYKLHELWLSEHSIDAEFDWVRIYFLTRCPRDVHP